MSRPKNVITVEFELTLSHIGQLPSKLGGAQILWKWKKGKAPKDSGTSAKFTLPDDVPSFGILLSLPVTFKSRLTQSQADKFEAKELACSVKYVRLRDLFSHLISSGHSAFILPPTRPLYFFLSYQYSLY